MDANVYPDTRAWYQPFLPFPGGLPGYGTAVDAVFRGFDLGVLRGLETRYLLAAAQLDRRKARTALLTEQHGFEDRCGEKHICPRMLQDLLDVLPEDEPMPAPRGLGGAPRIPFAAFLTAFVLAPFYEVEDNSAAVWRALANNPTFLCRCGFLENELPDVRSFQRFNEVMNVAGLWGEARRLVVGANLASGALKPPGAPGDRPRPRGRVRVGAEAVPGVPPVRRVSEGGAGPHLRRDGHRGEAEDLPVPRREGRFRDGPGPGDAVSVLRGQRARP